MKTFEDIQSRWANMPEPKIPKNGVHLIMEKIGTLKRKQRIASTVLTLTAIILLFFFFYITAYRSTPTMLGLFMMIGALLARIALEVISTKSLGRLDVKHDALKFKRGLVAHFSRRRWIHFLITPVAFITYVVGFVILLPGFKESLSAGFYTYVVVSSIVILAFLAGFISFHIYKEHLILKSFKVRES
nr:hypothetical protein [Allomuricauda sp.]